MIANSLAPELTLDAEERSSIYAWTEVFTMFGLIAASIAPGIMEQYVHDEREVFFYMSSVVACLNIALFGIMLFSVQEPKQVSDKGNPIVPGLRRAWRNRPFRILLSSSVFWTIAHTISHLMLPFYVSYVLNPRNYSMSLSITLLCVFGSSTISVPLWNRLSRSFDKRSLWLFGWIFHIPATFLKFFLGEGDFWKFIFLIIFNGLSYGGSSYLYKAIQADTIDYDELRTCKRREGQYITFWALIPKLVAIPSSAIPLMIIDKVCYSCCFFNW